MHTSSPSPPNENPNCEQCGKPLPPRAPGGLCPACLFGQALDVPPEPANHDDYFLDASLHSSPPIPHSPLSTSVPFGDYELIEKIAEGGMGVVYKARQLSLNRVVALKVIQPLRMGSTETVLRFRAEAEAAASLRHPHIVAIHETGECEGQHYFSMDYIEGQNLAQVISNFKFEISNCPRVARWIKTVAEAVHYAHQQGILHRDLKPSNVLVDQADQAHVADFGLARRLDSDSTLTLTGQVFGSPSFIPPEQASGQRGAVGVPGDVYGLGAILYYALTRRPPFVGQTVETTLIQVLQQEPVAPRLLNASIPRDLETICLKCLEKEPGRRYASAQAVADELDRFLNQKPILARPVGVLGKVWKWCRRQPVRAGLLAALILVFGLGLTGVLWQWQEAEQQRRMAQTNELAARQNAYAADMRLAQLAFAEHGWPVALELLEKHRPVRKAENRKQRTESGKQKAEDDLRGWEWRYLWQLCQPYESVRLQTNAVPIGAAAISRDGRVLAAAGADQKIVVWDLIAKKLLGEWPSSGSIGKLALSSNGGVLAASTLNPRKEWAVDIWDAKAGKIQATLGGPVRFRSLALSPDGTLLATFDDKGINAIVEWASGQVLTHWLVPQPRHTTAGVVEFSPDGHRLAIGEDYRQVELLDWRTGNRLRITNVTEEFFGVAALAFSPANDLLAVGLTGRFISLRDAISGEPRGQVVHPGSMIQALVFTPDGQELVSAGLDRTIRLWRVADQVELVCLQGHEGEGEALAFLPDGETLVSSCKESTACFWNIKAAQQPRSHRHLRIAYGSGEMMGPDPQGVVPQELRPQAVRRFGFTFTPDSRSFITTDPEGTLGVWDMQSFEPAEQLPALGSNCWGVALSPDGHWLAVGTASGKITIWEWPTRRLVKSFNDAPFQWLGYLEFLVNGQFLMARIFGNDFKVSVRFWQTNGWTEVPLAAIQATGPVSADLSPDGRLLATGYRNGAIKEAIHNNLNKLTSAV